MASCPLSFRRTGFRTGSARIHGTCATGGDFSLDTLWGFVYRKVAFSIARGARPTGRKRGGLRKRLDLKKESQWLDHIAIVTQVGLTIAGSILFCLLIGYYLDKWLGTKPLFILVFILLGIAGGGYTAYRQIMEVTEQDGEHRPTDEHRK